MSDPAHRDDPSTATESAAPQGRGKRRRRARWGLLAGILAVGLLFWGRLLLLSEAPRTAMAIPEALRRLFE